ncbi:MAG: protein kinase [Pirellula sp.]
MTSALFWERLQATGLASPEVCRQWAKEIEASLGIEYAGDPLKLASSLLRSGKLTPFQLTCISETHPPSLVVGPYRLVDTLSDQLGPNWFEAVHTTQNTKKWCLQLRPGQLCSPEIKNWPPSIEFGKAHKDLQCPFLDRWESVIAGQGTLSCFGDPVPGKPLSQHLQDGPISVEASTRIILQIADALNTLHSNKLVHGNVSTHLCWYDGANCVLRRNILFVPVAPYSGNEDWVFKKDEQDRWMRAAPEFVLPDAKPSPQTDLYSLGIVWLQLLNGVSAWKRYGSLDALGWKKIHTQETPEIPMGLPEPIVSLLKSLIAKNPSSRCKTAAGLHRQLVELTTLGQSHVIVNKPATNTSKKSVASGEPLPEAATKAPEKANAIAQPQSLSSPASAKSSLKTPAPATPAPATSVQASVKQPSTSHKSTKAPLAPKASSPKKSDAVASKRKKKKPAWFLPVLALGSMAFMGGLVALLSSLGGGGGKPDSETKVVVVPNENNTPGKDSTANKTAEVKTPTTNPIEEYFSISSDDGKSLWAPPSVGPSYSVELLPPGLELMAVFSGGAWIGQQTGPIQAWLLESLPDWKSFISSYPKVDDEQIKRVTVAAYASTTPATSDVLLRIELKSPVSIKDMISRNPSFREQRLTGAETELYCWSNGTLAIAFEGLSKDAERKVTTFSVGPSRIINTLIDTSGGSAPLSRQLESLIGVSNSEMDLFVMTTPSFLNGNGRQLYASVPRFKEAYREIVGDTIQAFSLSASTKDSFYLEGRMIVGDIAKSGSVLSTMREKLDSLANRLESQFATNPVAPYWRLIAARFPQMVRSVAKNTRMGIEEGQLVFNMYQPRESVDNLAIGTWMAMQSSVPDSSTSVAMPSNKTGSPKLSVEDMLNRPMSLAFAQESLEMSLAAIATEFNDSLPEGENKLEMSINGGAFQKEGITQNQQIRDFSFEKVPLRELLTALVRRANPVTTVQSPTEKDQKVVWLVLENASTPGGKKVELTTRSWAEANGVQLPKEFVP